MLRASDLCVFLCVVEDLLCFIQTVFQQGVYYTDSETSALLEAVTVN
jgi:hypothetical protein